MVAADGRLERNGNRLILDPTQGRVTYLPGRWAERVTTNRFTAWSSGALVKRRQKILRKEVIQPQVPLRLPCYDLVPITELILGACFLTVSAATWDAPRFRGLTGGVYKAQEHIHRGMLTRDY